MNTTTRIVRKNFAGDSISHDYVAVTLASVPGVSIDGDRSDTAPMQPAIRAKKQAPRGAALLAAAKRRANMFRQALIEVAQEIEE